MTTALYHLVKLLVGVVLVYTVLLQEKRGEEERGRGEGEGEGEIGVCADWSPFHCTVVLGGPEVIEYWRRYYEGQDGIVSVLYGVV